MPLTIGSVCDGNSFNWNTIARLGMSLSPSSCRIVPFDSKETAPNLSCVMRAAPSGVLNLTLPSVSVTVT